MSNNEPVIGKDCFLYYSTDFDTIAWTLIAHARDVNSPLTKNKIALPDRAAKGWNPKAGGLKEIGVEFGYLYQSGSDAVFDVLMDSFLNDTVLYFFVADGPVADPNWSAQGFRFPGQVFDYPHDEALEDGVTYNV
ncbi:MAG: hypothetical protein AAFP69_06735, partial [Planctomycetota bacterium]